MFTIGAFGIIFNEKGYVLLSHRRDRDRWNLPGGGMESHELPNEAVIREVKEETGLDVVTERLVGVFRKADMNELVFAFVCRVVGGQLEATDEADQHQYFSLSEIPGNIPPMHFERIQDSLRVTGQPIFRRQTAPSSQVIIGKV